MGTERLVVVGASLAGFRAAGAARQLGYAGELVLVGDESHFPPYDRPPLSKQVLMGEIHPAEARLQSLGDEVARLELRLGVRAVSLDVQTNVVGLADGGEIAFDKLIVATGCRARDLSGQQRSSSTVTLRTFEDSVKLREALLAQRRVAIIGAGFIGCEVAAAAVRLGCPVTVIDELEHPLERTCAAEVGQLVRSLHERHGVRFVTSSRVVGLGDDESPGAVELDSGERLDADVVVVGIGAIPNTSWLEGSGVPLNDGLVCRPDLLVEGFAAIAGIGDVCRWFNPHYERYMRVEHWTNAVEQAPIAVASLLAGGGTEFSSIPYVWSDQYDAKIQSLGVASDHFVLLESDEEQARLVGVYLDAVQRTVGATAVNRPALLGRLRRAVAQRLTLDQIAAAPVSASSR